MRALVVVLFVGCISSSAVQTQAVVSPDQQEKLRILLPNAAKIGAQNAGAPVFYGENLWEYIDGAAEAFHQYGFVALINQEYRVDDVDVTIDVYDMGEPRNAFGMYVAERSAEAKTVEVGVEGHADDFSLCFFQGPYYVKIAGFRTDGVATPTLMRIGRAVSESIGGERALPEGLVLLPEEGRVPRSESFVLTAPLGHAFLAPAFMARYASGEKEMKLVLSEARSPDEALARQRRMESHFRKAGELAPATAMEGAFIGSSSYEGRMFFVALESHLVILSPPPDDPRPLIEAIRGRMRLAH
jgi:hypothetical protein